MSSWPPELVDHPDHMPCLMRWLEPGWQKLRAAYLAAITETEPSRSCQQIRPEQNPRASRSSNDRVETLSRRM